MSKKILSASVHVPQYPRVRFFTHSPDNRLNFNDITQHVAKLIIEDLEEPSGYCALWRLDAQDNVVWKTHHPSLQETKWHAEFEYGLPEEKWSPYNVVAQ